MPSHKFREALKWSLSEAEHDPSNEREPAWAWGVFMLAVCWLLSVVYLLVSQLAMVSPFYSFFALHRIGAWLAIFLNLAIGIGLAFRLVTWRPFSFTVKSMLVIVVLISFPLSMAVAIQNHASMNAGFAYSKNDLKDAVSDGKAGENRGCYSITDIDRQDEYTVIYVHGIRDSFDACGFVYVQKTGFEISLESTGMDRSSFYSLGDGWYVFYSTYKWLKMGPS